MYSLCERHSRPQTFFDDWLEGELVSGLFRHGAEVWDVSLLSVLVGSGVHGFDLSHVTLLKPPGKIKK